MEITLHIKEKEEALSCLFGPEYMSILMDIDNAARGCLKHNEEKALETLEEIRGMIPGSLWS